MSAWGRASGGEGDSEIAGDPLTRPAGASSKWQFVFHLGTISRLATFRRRRRAGFIESPTSILDKMPATIDREYYITHSRRGRRPERVTIGRLELMWKGAETIERLQ